MNELEKFEIRSLAENPIPYWLASLGALYGGSHAGKRFIKKHEHTIPRTLLDAKTTKRQLERELGESISASGAKGFDVLARGEKMYALAPKEGPRGPAERLFAMAYPEQRRAAVASSDPYVLLHELGHVKRGMSSPLTRIRKATSDLAVGEVSLKNILAAMVVPYAALPDEIMAWREAKKIAPEALKKFMWKKSVLPLSSYGGATLSAGLGLAGNALFLRSIFGE